MRMIIHRYLVIGKINFFLTEVEDNQCQDWDNGATDLNGESCVSWYNKYPKDCGRYDDDDFTAKIMCCECKNIDNYMIPNNQK